LTGAAQGHETAERSIDEDTIWSRLHDEILTPARTRLGRESWDSATRDGAVLTVHDAINLALARGRFAATAPVRHAPSAPWSHGS
jgi:hypothetical protein